MHPLSLIVLYLSACLSVSLLGGTLLVTEGIVQHRALPGPAVYQVLFKHSNQQTDE